MKENEAPITLKNNKTLALLDLPGFDRLRNQYWEKFKFRAKGIIFVIDSLNFMSNVHNVADLLYHYLCDSFVVSNRIPVLIACTKQDETRAKSAKVISSMLEKELYGYYYRFVMNYFIIINFFFSLLIFTAIP